MARSLALLLGCAALAGCVSEHEGENEQGRLIYDSGITTVRRITDPERGVTCYIMRGSYKGGIWCFR